MICSSLVRTELRRAIARAAKPEAGERITRILATAGVLALRDSTLDRAGELSPPSVRTLDAIHLAVALQVADLIDALVTYDGRLAEAARANGLEVWSPGATV